MADLVDTQAGSLIRPLEVTQIVVAHQSSTLPLLVFLVHHVDERLFTSILLSFGLTTSWNIRAF
jgi:hypothetical protein